MDACTLERDPEAVGVGLRIVGEIAFGGPNRAPVAQPRPATLPEAQQVESVNANLKAMVGRIAQNAQNPSAANPEAALADSLSHRLLSDIPPGLR